MSNFKCYSLEENVYGEQVCRYTGCRCNCNSRKECSISDCYEHSSYTAFEQPLYTSSFE